MTAMISHQSSTIKFSQKAYFNDSQPIELAEDEIETPKKEKD
jgi:hypothetical protein